MPRLKRRYQEEIVPALMERFGYKNVWQVPRLVKVSVNMGVSGAKEDYQTLEKALEEVALIIGQRPAVTRARKSISAFGVRQGMPVGLRATLRGERMWDFLDKLFNLALPRIRDFRGPPRDAFDGRGNYTIGITDHLIFPELTYDDIERQRGMDITIVTTAPTDEEAMALLEELGMPLARE
ncbi:MAG: 50S ribosomal protein L5 [Armatimonadetes bacterium]|nr:50S ribosomal protein L5 [Armatimonadota bacterium]